MPPDSIIVGLGDPVMDIVAQVSHAFLASVAGEAGGCFPVPSSEMTALLEAAGKQSELKRIPGGSAANVMKGLANISHGSMECRFVGMIGKDPTGAEYRSELASQHVTPLLLESDSGKPSASALCFVTPDGQRTMRTCLGASLDLQTASQLPSTWSDDIQLLHCEGYCLYRPSLTKELTLAAKQKGALVSIDLASFELVRNCKEGFLSLLKEGCLDILFANQEEAVALAEELQLVGTEADRETKLQAAQQFLLQYIKVSVVSKGPKGCCARDKDGKTGESGAADVVVVDTIGAGDCFTAGFLYAWLHGGDLTQCSAAGCAAGAEAVQTQGAELPAEAWARLQDGIALICGEKKPGGEES